MLYDFLKKGKKMRTVNVFVNNVFVFWIVISRSWFQQFFLDMLLMLGCGPSAVSSKSVGSVVEI